MIEVFISHGVISSELIGDECVIRLQPAAQRLGIYVEYAPHISSEQADIFEKLIDLCAINCNAVAVLLSKDMLDFLERVDDAEDVHGIVALPR